MWVENGFWKRGILCENTHTNIFWQLQCRDGKLIELEAKSVFYIYQPMARMIVNVCECESKSIFIVRFNRDGVEREGDEQWEEEDYSGRCNRTESRIGAYSLICSIYYSHTGLFIYSSRFLAFSLIHNYINTHTHTHAWCCHVTIERWTEAIPNQRSVERITSQIER